ncbi:MAG: hypothetical protein H6818_19205 [Phycisphaerales bacterium]|nr:hypothetical protein [Phycisphaerales bacterium]
MTQGHVAGENCLLTARAPGYDCIVRRTAKALLVYALAFAFGFFVMLYFASAPKRFSDGTQAIGVSGNDSFYHIKMASMLPEVGLVDKFPWLQYAYFREPGPHGDEFVSHHYGFHVLLLPFVKVSEWLTGEPLSGGRWAVSAFFGVNVMLFFAILRTARVPWAWVWLLLFMLLPFQFFMRHAYVRAIGPSLICMLLLVLFVIQRRALAVAIVAALSNHVYLGSIMYTPVIIGAFAAACVVDRGGWAKFPWQIVIAAVIGWAVGAVTYPYMGGMFEFLKLQVFGTGLAPDIEVGREWKPYEGVWWFATTLAGPLLLIFAGAAIVRFRLGPRLDADEMFLLLLNFGFLVLTLKARRFVEYWPAFAILSAALMARTIIPLLTTERLEEKEPASTDDDGASGELFDYLWLGGMFVTAVAILGRGVILLVRNAETWKLAEGWPLAIAGASLLVLTILFGAESDSTSTQTRVAGAVARSILCLAGMALIALIGFKTNNWQSIREGSQLRFDLPEVRKMMAFLKADSKPGAVIFTTDWDDFPLFFYHNSYDYYVVGLDPKFTHARRPDLWERYVKITRAQAPAKVSVNRVDDEGKKFTDRIDVKVSDIRDEFRADYVITDSDHSGLAGQLSREKDLAELVYPCREYSKCRNSPYLVFRIHSAGVSSEAPVGPDAASRPAD